MSSSSDSGANPTPTPTLSPVPSPQGPLAMTGNFAYAVNIPSHTISGYTINAQGVLRRMPAPFPSSGLQPNAIAIAVKGTRKFAYVANNGSDNITAYEINTSTGTLTELSNLGSPFSSAGHQPGSITVDPQNRFLYVTNYGSNTVSVYMIEANGDLTKVQGAFGTGVGPQSIAVDPAGKFAYVANFDANTVSAYEINPSTGALNEIQGSPFATGSTGRGPNAITVAPLGKFVYVVNLNTNNVSAYTIDVTTGALTAVSVHPSGVGPEGVIVDPTEKYVYVGNGTSNDITAYTINAITGELTPISGPTFSAGNDPEGMAVDPTGKFVYAVNRGSLDVSAYRIEADGRLTDVQGSPFNF